MFVYADNAATTSMSPLAMKTLSEAMETTYGNPSSLHQKGREANLAMIAARRAMAERLGADERELYFTGCGTEADNWALRASGISSPPLLNTTPFSTPWPPWSRRALRLPISPSHRRDW